MSNQTTGLEILQGHARHLDTRIHELESPLGLIAVKINDCQDRRGHRRSPLGEFRGRRATFAHRHQRGRRQIRASVAALSAA